MVLTGRHRVNHNFGNIRRLGAPQTRGPHEISISRCQDGFCLMAIALFGDAYEKIGTIQRRLAWPLHKDDTLFQSGRPTGLNIYFCLFPTTLLYCLNITVLYCTFRFFFHFFAVHVGVYWPIRPVVSVLGVILAQYFRPQPSSLM